MTRDIELEMHDAHTIRSCKGCAFCDLANYVLTRLPYAEEIGAEIGADFITRSVKMRRHGSAYNCYPIELGASKLDAHLHDLSKRDALDQVVGIAAERLECGDLVCINPETGRITKVRQFDSGATRDTDQGKIDYRGFLSVEVLRKYGEYMLRHQKQADGQLRASDNWKKGIPRDAYIESMYRHFMEVVALHERGEKAGTTDLLYDDINLQVEIDEALYALLFNVMGYGYEREMGR